MTMIVNGYATKKALKEDVAAGNYPLFHDHSLMESWLQFGKANFSLRDLTPGDVFCVTNHPKRSWFAEVKCTAPGQYKVS